MSGNVPNTPPPITPGEIWTPAQWTNAWQQKLDTTGGVLTGLLNASTISMNPGGGAIVPAYPVGNSAPVADLTPANTILAELVVQSQSADPIHPEWTGVFGNWSTAGQASGAQKVALYAGAVQSQGSGPVWSLNTLVTRAATQGTNNTGGGPGNIGSGTPGPPGSIPLGTVTIGYELDWNNFDQDLPVGSGFGVGMWINMLGSYAATAAIYMSNIYDHGLNNYGWHDGILFSGANLIKDNTIFDGTSSTFSYQIAGTHTDGILDVSTSINGYQSNGTRSGTNFLISDSAPTVMGVNGSHTSVIDVTGATITGHVVAGLLTSPYSKVDGALTGTQWQTQGAYAGWNFSSGSGATDLVNSKGLGAGGFNFWNVSSSLSATPTLLASIDGVGDLVTAGGVTATALSTGGFSVNSAGAITAASMTAQYWRGPGSTYTFGASLPSYISYLNANYTGAYTGGSANTVPYLWDITGDSADLRNFNAGFPVAQFNHSFGGTGTYGGRTGIRVFVNTVGNFNDTVTTQQHVGAELWMQMAHNVGGISGTPAGYAYAANPQVLLLPGASYWSQANALGEINIGITASNQPVTVGGTVENGDTLSITFASSVISGSPVTVSCTTSASQTLAMVANNLVAAVNSSVALQNARVAATRNGNVVELWWQGQDTVSPSVTSGVAATLTLGSFVQGASVQDKAMATMIRLAGDGGDGINTSYFLAIGSQSAPTSGQMRYGIAVGAEWSIRRDGTIFGVTSPQTAHGGTGRSDPFPPQFCAYGVDMFYANFSKESGAGYRSVGMVDRANGVLELRNTKLTASSTGMAMDVTGLVASAVAISSGGGGGAGNPQNNYFPGDLIGDNYGGQYEITAVNTSTGAATAFNVLVYPATTGSTPSNPVSTFGGSGTGLTLTITWPGAGALSLNPGGATVQLGSGCFTANGSTAVSLTSIAPSGAHATVQEWLTVKDASGTVRYIPCF